MEEARIAFFKNTLNRLKLDAFLVSNFYNIFYLTGFATLVDNERESWLLITKNSEYIFTDERYFNGQGSKNFKLLAPENSLIKQVKDIINEEKISTIGFEGEDLKFSEYQKFNENLKEINFISTDKLIIKQRATKDSKEIDSLTNACKIADECFSAVVKNIKIGISEKEIAFKMEMFLKEKDYDFSFYPIIAIDKNSAIAHYDTRAGNDEKVKSGSVILMDFGVKYERYLSDVTRMVFVGDVHDEIIKTYEKLLMSQTKTIQYLDLMHTQDGSYYKDVDKYCRQQLASCGLPRYAHSTGHGVGLEIHEYPKVSYTTDEVMRPNEVITIEPGVYFNGKWGMRIEDTVLIDEDKKPIVLTKSSKKFPSISI